MSHKWDLRFLELARHIAQWSKDPSTKCGAVIVDSDRRIISLGYNGLPQGVTDLERRLDDRELKYQLIVHAERNAILFAQRSLTNCTLYTWPFMCCSVCAAMVIQTGITRHVAPVYEGERWTKSFQLTQEIMAEAHVELETLEWTEIPPEGR